MSKQYSMISFWMEEITFKVFMSSLKVPSHFISRNWPKCNHSIYDYMRLLVICNYIWTFLQLFLILVIFATPFGHFCNYFLFWSYLQLHLDIFATISYFGHICNYIAISLQLFWCSSFHVNNV